MNTTWILGGTIRPSQPTVVTAYWTTLQQLQDYATANQLPASWYYYQTITQRLHSGLYQPAEGILYPDRLVLNVPIPANAFIGVLEDEVDIASTTSSANSNGGQIVIQRVYHPLKESGLVF